MAVSTAGAGPRESLSSRFDRRLAPYSFSALLPDLRDLRAGPILYTVCVALFNWNPIGKHVFIGFDNYVRLFADPRFWNAAENTISIWLLSTVPQLVLALGLAHLLNHARLRLAVFFRMSMLMCRTSPRCAATTIFFAQIFDRDYGLLNWLLGFVGVEPIDFNQSVWGSHVLIADHDRLALVRLHHAASTWPPCRRSRARSTRRRRWTAPRVAAVPPLHPAAAGDHHLHGHHLDHRRPAGLRRAAHLLASTSTCGRSLGQCQTLTHLPVRAGLQSSSSGTRDDRMGPVRHPGGRGRNR